MRIKICGVTRPADADRAVAAGADAIVLNFWPRSKRAIGVDAARPVVAAAGTAATVGVFVDAPVHEVVEIARELALDVVQLHGDETRDTWHRVAEAAAGVAEVAVAIRVGSAADIARIADAPGRLVVLDAPGSDYGGMGVTGDWALAADAVSACRTHGKLAVLAGGLAPDNVAAAVAAVRPDGVDVASGVESAPGIKDGARIDRFVAAAAAALDGLARGAPEDA